MGCSLKKSTEDGVQKGGAAAGQDHPNRLWVERVEKKVKITKRTQISEGDEFRTLRVMNQLQKSGVGILYTCRMKTKPSSGHKGEDRRQEKTVAGSRVAEHPRERGWKQETGGIGQNSKASWRPTRGLDHHALMVE